MAMERAVTATEANRHFSQILREVAEGGSVTVTLRGRPVARIVPVEIDRQDQKRKISELLKWLEKMPIRYAGSWKREDLYD